MNEKMNGWIFFSDEGSFITSPDYPMGSFNPNFVFLISVFQQVYFQIVLLSFQFLVHLFLFA